MPDSDPRRSRLDQRYADLLPAGQEDAALTQLVLDLDAVMHAPSPVRQQQRIGQLLLAQAAARYHARSEHVTANVTLMPRQPQPQPTPSLLGALVGRSLAVQRTWIRRPLMTAALVLLALVVFSGGTAFALGQINLGLPGGWQLMRSAAVAPHYNPLNLSHTVGDTSVTLTKAALTKKNALIGYTYDTPVQSQQNGTVCPRSLTSSEGDTFHALAGDYLPDGKPTGLSHGFVMIYFMVDHLQGTSQARHLHLVLHLCGSTQPDNPVVFDFTVPLQS